MTSLATPTQPAGTGLWTFYGSVTISAPAKDIWDALVDFQSYSKWNFYTPTIDTPNPPEVPQPGHIIHLHYRPESTGSTMKVPCEILEVESSKYRIVWRGKAFNLPLWVLSPEKVQTITELVDGKCKFEIWETQSGLLAFYTKYGMGKKLSQMNQGIAEGLKGYVEGKRRGE
ncbi:MAG: hypothetical protein M1820_005444 [Bogoriella megaspora]|nr:MAG: hypothetical protein M1820_005444 [Bogoriella megaspora]